MSAQYSREASPVARPGRMANLLQPLSFPWALVLGAASIVLAKYVFYHANDLPKSGHNADMAMMLELGFGALALTLCALAFKMNSKTHLACKMAGLVGTHLALHNIVHLYPANWASLFSREWVAWILSTTEPNSILFRGLSIPLG